MSKAKKSVLHPEHHACRILAPHVYRAARTPTSPHHQALLQRLAATFERLGEREPNEQTAYVFTEEERITSRDLAQAVLDDPQQTLENDERHALERLVGTLSLKTRRELNQADRDRPTHRATLLAAEADETIVLSASPHQARILHAALMSRMANETSEAFKRFEQRLRTLGEATATYHDHVALTSRLARHLCIVLGNITDNQREPRKTRNICRNAVMLLENELRLTEKPRACLTLTLNEDETRLIQRLIAKEDDVNSTETTRRMLRRLRRVDTFTPNPSPE